METLKNSHVELAYNPGARGSDIFDGRSFDANPRMLYNRTSRGHKSAWIAVKAAWNNDTTLWDAIDVLNAHGIQISTCSY